MSVAGTVLVQPQRMRRARVTEPEITLAAEVLNLIARLVQDEEQSQQIALVAKNALEEAFKQILQQRLSALRAAGPRLADWLLRVLRATTGFGPELRFSNVGQVLTVFRTFVDAIAKATKEGNADRIRPYVVELVDIGQKDLGFSFPALETMLWNVVDTIIVRLEALPLEPQRAARENRLDTIRILRRIRQLVRGKFPLPVLDADRIANALADALRSFNVPAASRAAQCVSDALQKIEGAATALDELVPLGPMNGFRSLGAAAAVASGETYCWYASWLYAEDVVINKEKTQIRRGDKVILEGSGLTPESIPEFSTATPRYTFNALNVEQMDAVTVAMYCVADLGVVTAHLVSTEKGDLASNVINAINYTIILIGKGIFQSPMLPTVVEDWVVPPVGALAGSFEGLQTKGTAFSNFKNWLTLFVPDAFEAILYKQVSIIVRDLVLSFFTLLNYDGPFTSETDPDTRPLNRKHIDGVAWIGEYFGGFVFMKFYPKDEYAHPFETSAFSLSNRVSSLSGKHVAKYWLFWNLFLSNLCYFVGRLSGCALAMGIGRVFDVEPWFKPMPLQVLLKGPLLFTASLYMDKEGKTDDGKYNPNGKAFAGYPDKATAPYTLPFLKDKKYYLVQGNQGMWSNNHIRFDQTYGYDFSLDQDEPVLAARAGTVVDYFDWIPNDTNPNDAEQTAAETEAAASGALATGQTRKDTWNFIAIRHDCDESLNALPPNTAHDKAEGGRVVTTYAIYAHARKDSVRGAFAARSISASSIIGTKVKTGQRIMLAGNTGRSFHNLLHMKVVEGPAAPSGPATAVPRASLPQPTLPFVFKEIGAPQVRKWITGTQEELT